MRSFALSLRRSLRSIRRHPATAVTVILTLALGIGANTAMFSVVNGVLLRPLAYREADRLVTVFAHETRRGEPRNPTSPPADFLDWKQGSRALDQMTAAHPWAPVLTGRGGPEPIPGLKATPELFALLQAAPALGRVFDPEPRVDSAGAVVVLSHRLWQRRFGGEPRIVGQSLTLDGQPHTVVGVMPPGFRFPPFWATDAELWTPLRLTAQDHANHARMLRVFARLRPGFTVEQARKEMAVIGQRLAAERPATNAGVAINVEPLREPVVSRVRPALLVLLGAVAFVLLIACANVTSLLLAQGLRREKELALRAALGAHRRRLVGQLLMESVTLAVVGGLAGLWLASLGVQALRLLLPEGFPRLDEIALDERVAAFNLLLSLATGILAGIVPAFRASRADLTTALKQGDRLTGSGGRQRLHDALVIGEFALALVLLVGAGLLTKSFLQRLDPRPGFRTDGLLTMSLSLSSSPLGEPARQRAFFDELLTRVRAVPGVGSAALVNHMPIAGDTWRTPFAIEGRPFAADELPSAVFRVVTSDYLDALGIPILRGRPFGQDGAETSPVVLVNQTLASRFWADGNAVGQRLRAGGTESEARWATIVGVVGDARQASVSEPIQPEILVPYSDNPVAWYRSTTLVIRTDGEPLSLAEAVKSQVWALDGQLPVTQVRSIDQILAEAAGGERFGALLLGLFALTALLLAAIGIYGVMAYSVSRRAHEIGMRMALGARSTQVFTMVVGRGVLLGSLGAILGLAAALALSRFLAGLLFGISATDPATLGGVTLLLLGVSALACALPALRASRVDPLLALRDE